MNYSLRVRIILAVISGIACALTWHFIRLLPPHVLWLELYGLSGLFFAAGVLFPYVGPGKLRHVRYLGLVLACAVGYWCAFWLALEGPGTVDNTLPFSDHGRLPTWISVMVGSIAGVGIVMLAPVLIAPIRASFAYVLLGILAAVGGVLLFIVSIIFFSWFLRSAAAFAAWHTLVCLAIYFGTPSTSAGARFSGGLVRLVRRQA